MANDPATIAALKTHQETAEADAETPQEAPTAEDTEVPGEAENAQEAPAQPEEGPSEASQPPRVPGSAGLTVAQAEKQGDALRRAARSSPIRQLRYMLNRLAREWEHAAAEMMGSEDEVTIELVGSLSMGMRVPCSNKNGAPDIGVLVRVMTRDGQTSLHLEPEGSPMPVYLNFALPSSPVVVYR